MLRHMMGLFAYQRVAKVWRRYLTERLQHASDAVMILPDALRLLPNDILDACPLHHGQEFIILTDEE